MKASNVFPATCRWVGMFVGVAMVLTQSTALGQTADAALLARTKEYAAAVKANDIAKVAAFYTEDAMSFCEGCPVTKGRSAIQASMKTLAEYADMSTTIIEARSSGDIGYVVGRFAFPAGGPQKGRTGIYVEIWKRVGGQWLIAYDTFSTEMAAK